MMHSHGSRTPPRPSWALAYILQDWKRQRDVAKAYKLASADDGDLSERPSEDVFQAVLQARARLVAYTAALDSVLERWSVTP